MCYTEEYPEEVPADVPVEFPSFPNEIQPD